MKPLWLTFVMALALSAPAPAAEDLDAAQQAAQANNPAGITCMLALPDGRTQFQQGEIIRLTLSFTSSQPRAYRMLKWSFRSMDQLHVSPAEGAVNPMADVPPQKMFTYEGPPPPAPVPIGSQPVTVSLTVNDSLRFDRPGVYKLYVTSSRLLDSTAKSVGLFVEGKVLPAVSNSVQIQIVPADPAWAQAQVSAARTQIQDHYSGPTTVYDPWGVLQFLGTPESARVLLSVMAANKYPRSSESKGGQCRPGLIGYPDRAWLLGEMERDLDAPDYAVTPTFISTLAELAAYQNKSKESASFQRLYWLRAARAVQRKTDAARPMTLHTLLEEAWLTSEIGKNADVQARVPELTRRMALDFDRLPPLPQDYLLGDDWTKFRSPALLPALRRFWANAKLTENTNIFDAHNAELNGLVLRRIRELSPQEGRMLILQEAASISPRADMSALGSLPDATLPALDTTLASHLAARRNVDMTCQLIARYATDTALPQAQAYDAKMQDFTTEVSLLAYFLRVRPEYGQRMLHQALLRWLGRGSMETLMVDVADTYYGPALEKFAFVGLNNPDPGIVADAARTLGQHGSPGIETALWARLRKPEPPGRSRSVLEEALAQSLATGQNWYESPARLKQIRALCVTEEGRRAIDEFISRIGTGKVHMDYEIGDVGYWTIGQYNGKGRASFLVKIAQFPRGTFFTWQDIGFGPEEEKLYSQAQAVAFLHKQTLERAHFKPFAG